MMLQRHYDEESLIAILHSGQDASRDPHLAACKSCSDTLDSYRAIAEVLGEDAVWDLREGREENAVRGVEAIRSFAAAMESSDHRAAELVDEMIQSPRQWWVATVTRDERYHNPGVVRRLVEVAETKIDTMPPDAVELAGAAIALTENLENVEHVLQLRGAAFRQHAYALFYTGDFTRSLESVERAQKIFEQCVVSEYPLARLDIVRALVFGAQERYAEALQAARSAARTFRMFGDTQKLVSALMAEAYLLMGQHNWREALPLLLEIDRDYAGHVDVDTRARTLANIGACQQWLGDLADSVRTYQISAALYDENGTATEAVRIRHNVGLLLVTMGKQSEARKRLREVQAEYERLGMIHTAVVAGLDLAEVALLENNLEEVEQLCRTAIRQFESAGIAHSSEALTALTFLREAAEQRRATQEIVWHVKTYIRRLPNEPALLFAPAPLPPA